jgi:hypothetical protein
MTDPEFGLWVAHVSNVLEDFHGAVDYDATADYAACLPAAHVPRPARHGQPVPERRRGPRVAD